MLTRRQWAALAPVVRDAVVLTDGAHHLQLAPDCRLPLFNGGTPVAAFGEGWRPGVVLTLFRPLLVLEFVHENGGGGFWLLDEAGRFIGNDMRRLPARLLDIVRLRAEPILSWLQAAGPGLPCTPPASTAAFLAVHPEIRCEIARASRGPDGEVPSDRLLAGPPASSPLASDPLASDPTATGAGPDIRQLIIEAGRLPSLNPGWRIAGICTVFAPVIVVELVTEQGEEGVWYVDRAAAYLGNSALQLVGALRAHLQACCAAMFADAWDCVIMAPTQAPGGDLATFMSCSAAARIDLLNFHLGCIDASSRASHRWVLTQPPPPAMSYTVPTSDRRVVLDPDHTAAACLHFLRSELFELLEHDTMSWPSPVDGRRVETRGRALYFDDACFAYQLHDDRHDLTFYVFATAGFFRTFALYFPAADLVVASDASQMQVADPYTGAARERLLGHVMRFGMDLVQALVQEPGEIVHAFRGYPAIHLGHFVWQDLSGVSYLVDAFPPDRLPRFFVFDTQHHPEMYGPLEEIFPELDGKVVRVAHSLNQHIGAIYRSRLRVIKSTSMSVPAQVGRRIIAALRRSERWRQPVARAAAAHAAGPVILVGLRVGNRTIENIEVFASRLIGMLIQEIGTVTIVIDGHNSVEGAAGATYASFGDTLTGGSTFMQREIEIARALAREFAGSPATIIDNIERPIQESVIWCSEADFFVAPWGAALAKYRWVCNTPGLTTIGRWNLEHRNDVAIYHHPGAMEAPTPLILNAAEAAEDVAGPDADESEHSRSNYRLDERLVFAQVRELVATYIRRPAVMRPAAPGAASDSRPT